MHRLFARHLLLSLLFITLVTLPAQAFAASEIGAVCTEDDQCASEECETSTKKDANGRALSFCVCSEMDIVLNDDLDESADCAGQYEKDRGKAGNWVCRDGAERSFNVNYCQSKRDSSIVKLPFAVDDDGDISFLDSIFDTELVADEIAQQIHAPQPRINIPGLSFTSGENVKANTRIGADGNTYLYIPYLGEYLAAAYKYSIIIASVLAVIYIISHGFKIIMGGKNSEMLNESKTRIVQVIIGLIIALTSYVLLYSINPNLVKFKDLRVQYISREDVEDEGNPSTSRPSEEGVKVVSTSLTDLSCNLGKLKSYSEQNTTLGVDTGYCARWVSKALASLCQGIPAELNQKNAWDAAVEFKNRNRFVPCTLEGIEDGDIVFMVSMASNYIGLWENFRTETGFTCTVADAAVKPTRYDYDKINKIENLLPATPVQGLPKKIPPVTHIGVYYQGHVYHLTKSVKSSAVSEQATMQRTNNKKLNWRGITLSGQFIDGNSEFISGYGKWKDAPAPTP